MAEAFCSEALPLLFLEKLADYLNTREQANLLMVIGRVNKIKDLRKTHLFQLLFKPNKLDLSECYDLKTNDFKEYLKCYSRLEALESINLSLSSSISFASILKTVKFEALVELGLLAIKINEVDLLNGISSMKNLRSISFTVPRELSHTNLQPRLDVFNAIENATIDVDSMASTKAELFINALMENLINARRLEIISLARTSPLRLKVDLTRYRNKFEHLNQLFISSSNSIIFSDSTFIAQSIQSRRLHQFYTNCQLALTNLNVNDRLEIGMIPKTALHFIEINIESAAADLFEMDEFFGHLAQKFDSQMMSLIISTECQPIMIRELEPKMEELSNLTRLDLQSIHIHSSDCVLRTIANLKSLKHLYLPCCALVSHRTSENETRKRVLEAEDQPSEPRTSEVNQRPLEMFNSNEIIIVSFGLSSPFTLKTDKKDRNFFNCSNVSQADLDAILDWSDLRSLLLSDFKLMGDAKNFNSFLSKLASNNPFIKEIRLKNIQNFATFQFQSSFTTNLSQFESLESLHIEHSGFFFTQNLVNSLGELSNLKELKFYTSLNEPDLIKKRDLSPLNHLKKLALFDLKCGITLAEKTALKKKLKKILDHVPFLLVRKFEPNLQFPSTNQSNWIKFGNKLPKYHDIKYDYLNE